MQRCQTTESRSLMNEPQTAMNVEQNNPDLYDNCISYYSQMFMHLISLTVLLTFYVIALELLPLRVVCICGIKNRRLLSFGHKMTFERSRIAGNDMEPEQASTCHALKNYSRSAFDTKIDGYALFLRLSICKPKQILTLRVAQNI